MELCATIAATAWFAIISTSSPDFKLYGSGIVDGHKARGSERMQESYWCPFKSKQSCLKTRAVVIKDWGHRIAAFDCYPKTKLDRKMS